METSRWLESLLLPHSVRREAVRAWLAGRRTPRAVENAWREDAAQRRRWSAGIRARCEREGWHVVTAEDERLPDSCRHLHDPPAALFVAGDLGLLRSETAVGMVGARRGTERGRAWAEAMGCDLARADVAVVSGLAHGVDGASHRGCLRAGGRPVGVIGTGLDRHYPAAHRDLQRAVAANGCLVSEYPPGIRARPYHFLARNRILAALGRALVVVEAGARSGALSTVEFALQLGKDVMVVPGPVDSPHAQGCLRLLRDGAILVRHAGDILESLGLPARETSRIGTAGVDLSPATPEAVARRMGWSVARAISYLTELELEGRVRRVPGGRYVAVPGPDG